MCGTPSPHRTSPPAPPCGTVWHPLTPPPAPPPGPVQESPTASKIKESFLGDKGLAGAVKKLPLEKVFELANVKKVSGPQATGRGQHACVGEATGPAYTCGALIAEATGPACTCGALIAEATGPARTCGALITEAGWGPAAGLSVSFLGVV